MICNPVIAGGGSKSEWVKGRVELTSYGKEAIGTFVISRKAGATVVCRAINADDNLPALIIIRENNDAESYSNSGSGRLKNIGFSDTGITLEYTKQIGHSYADYEYVVF